MRLTQHGIRPAPVMRGVGSTPDAGRCRSVGKDWSHTEVRFTTVPQLVTRAGAT